MTAQLTLHVDEILATVDIASGRTGCLDSYEESEASDDEAGFGHGEDLIVGL